MSSAVRERARFAGLGVVVGLQLMLLLATGPRANPGHRITGISIFGNRVTKEHVLLRELEFRVGDDVSFRQVEEARQRLEELEFVSYADIQMKRPREGEVHLLVQVEEMPRLTWSPVLEHDERQEGLLLGLQFGVTNFRGRGERLGARVVGGAAQGVGLRWENPWILGPLHLAPSLRGSWDRYDFVYEPFRFTDARVGIGLQRRIGPWLRAGVAYEWRRVKLDFTDGIPEGVDPESDDPAVTLSLEHDSRDLPAYPRRGAHARLGWRVAGLSGGERYEIYDAAVASFLDPLWGVILGARAVWRGVDRPVPLYERSYLDGLTDVRGIADGSARGDEHFLASAELRWPALLLPLPQDDGTVATLAIGLHAFHDWGKAWRYGAAFDDARMRRTYGLGLHIAREQMALRFEWAQTTGGENRFLFADNFTF